MVICNKCGYSDNGTGDWAHVCGPVEIKESVLVAVDESHLPVAEQSLVFRLRKRAEIRRQIPGRLSVLENKPDRIATLLDEAADEIERLQQRVAGLVIARLETL